MVESNTRLERIAKAVNLIITSVIALTIVVFAFALLYASLFKNIQESNKDIILFVLGSVLTILAQVISFYFGSSKGYEDKNKIIRDSVNGRLK